ncbi:MAG: trigger factor [Alphaproteobacteria bacterium]|nr:trigger factor [Alphaproteobacteria bacterium]
MQVKQLKEDGLNYELEITVGSKEIDQQVDKRLAELQKTVKIQGFRPGKVPMAMMKQKYGKAVMGEVLEAAVNESTQKALADKKLTPAIQPKIEVKSFDEGKDLVYTMNLEVLPKITLKDHKGLKLEKKVAKASDKEIDDALERIASSQKMSEPVKGDRATKKGDIVVIDFHGRTADDNKAHEGMHAHGHHLELGGGQFIPGFEDQLIGKKVGDSVEVKVKFPEEYGAAELAGREAIFDVDINEVREPKETEVNDEFAKSLGLADLDALKKAIEEQTNKEFESFSRMKLKKQLLDALDEAYDFDVPAGMLEMEVQAVFQQVEMDKKQRGVTEELSKDEKAELEDIALRRVRLGLVLSEIGNGQKISVADAELQRAVISEAQKYPGQEKQVFDYYSKNRQALESLRAPIYEEKVVDFILELADVKEKEVTPEELTSEDEDEGSKPKKKASSKKSSEAKKDDSKKEEGKAESKPKSKKSSAKKKAS